MLTLILPSVDEIDAAKAVETAMEAVARIARMDKATGLCIRTPEMDMAWANAQRLTKIYSDIREARMELVYSQTKELGGRY